MSIQTPAIPQSSLDRFRWAGIDAWSIAGRDLRHWIREPVSIIFRLLYPIISVLLFGYVFGSAIVVAGGGNYREFLMPGLFAMTMMFGIGETMVAVVTDSAKGVTDRFRSMPMTRSGVVAGRSIADILSATLDLSILVVCGLAVGWRWHNGLGEALAAVGLLLLLRFSVIWVGIYLGLLVRTPEAANNLYALLFPITMLANTFVSPSQMPDWLGVIAEWNPLSSTVAATRELFGNPGIEGDSWIAQSAVLMAVVWPLLLIAVFMPLSVLRFRRLSR
ncbi:MAG: ABC transporter permease [Dehalococcoidia bacterium]